MRKENAATDKLIVTRPGFEADRKRARAILDDERQIAGPGKDKGNQITKFWRGGCGARARSTPGWRASPNGRC